MAETPREPTDGPTRPAPQRRKGSPGPSFPPPEGERYVGNYPFLAKYLGALDRKKARRGRKPGA